MKRYTIVIVGLIISAVIIRMAFLSFFTIPTGAMANTIVPGDFIVVLKSNFIRRYQVERNDITVFHYPGCLERPDEFGGFSVHAEIGDRTFYTKRCIGIGGDKLLIKDAQVFINGEQVEEPFGLQKWFTLESKANINPKIFNELEISERGSTVAGGKYYYALNATASAVESLKEFDFVTDIVPDIIPINDTQTPYLAFPYNSAYFNWNRDNFGEVLIPCKNMTVELTPQNIILYKGIITIFDHNENALFQDGKIFIDGLEVTSYTFKQDYFFMMGDNRYESDDSRFWGFVPEDHLVGKVLFY